MSLLPSNSTLQEQEFAKFIESRAREDYSVLSNQPLHCVSSLLGHIAVGYGVSIDGMTEGEARIYLSSIVKNRTIRGTVKAVEDTLDVVFQDAQLIEWFEADDLGRGEFRVNVTVRADSAVKYDARKFALSRKLIAEAKNVRSHLKDFNISLPQSHGDIAIYGGGVVDVRLANELRVDYPMSEINIQGVAIWTF